MLQFRDLTAEDIDVRVQSVSAKDGKPNGAILLLYKNARVDMNILDETVGAENWQREHYECKGNLYCRVGIKTDDKEKQLLEWVWKSDCGAESNSDAEKGEASDSFKRACVNWGIGRELYTSPLIWIKPDKFNAYSYKSNGGKEIWGTKDKFKVEKIAIENKKIVGLSIINTSLKVDDPKQKRCFVFAKQ